MKNMNRSLIISSLGILLLGAAATTQPQVAPLYYAGGILASNVGKQFGKWTVETQFGTPTKTPIGKALSLDVKFIFLELVKRYLTLHCAALGEMTTAPSTLNLPSAAALTRTPSTPNLASSASRMGFKTAETVATKLYKAGTKAPCIYELGEKIVASYDAWQAYHTQQPQSSKKDAVAKAESMINVQNVFDAINGLAIFTASYIITQASITSSERFVQPHNLPAPLPKVIATTMGVLMSAYVEEALALPAIRYLAHLIGLENKKARQFETTVYDAGMKVPFGWEGMKATWEALDFWKPTITHAITSGVVAALTTARQPRLMGLTAGIAALIAVTWEFHDKIAISIKHS